LLVIGSSLSGRSFFHLLSNAADAVSYPAVLQAGFVFMINFTPTKKRR